MTGRTHDGQPLTPGVNVDRINIAAGVATAQAIGFHTDQDIMIIVYALQRWMRGEEADAERMWLHYYPREFQSWLRIISAAQAAGEAAA